MARERGRPPKGVVSTPTVSQHTDQDNKAPDDVTPFNDRESNGKGTMEINEEHRKEEERKEQNNLDSQKGSTESRKLWVDVLSGNRNPGNGMTIEFIAPKIVNRAIEVEIDEEDIMTEVKFWDTALNMYVLGGDLNMNVVKKFMIKNRNLEKLPNM